MNYGIVDWFCFASHGTTAFCTLCISYEVSRESPAPGPGQGTFPTATGIQYWSLARRRISTIKY
jgi:hypothetical protein